MAVTLYATIGAAESHIPACAAAALAYFEHNGLIKGEDERGGLRREEREAIESPTLILLR